ncbi:ankyrin repeat-containing protein [Tieghemostelium lacteum]|uniref:Ankyrin repeat-containing protein n=1 Tax=Tieghemostelium lacteum TaxID=361077 RepID=A0A151Z4I5_TIELA|nr:ankyrin repeat-containing protein [Tieghemostelium lacteum]|eukprot:KYQ88870.1 ankyrin repeat-containing protein [Tieghemostelium lacteum]
MSDSNQLPKLHEAVLSGDYNDVLKLLENGICKLDDEDFGGLQALHFASRIGDIKIAQLLLSKGSNINAENNFGSTPLHEAVRRGEVDMVKFLISAGADLSIGDIDSNTPLHLAVMCEDGELIPILLAAGAPLNVKNKDDETPIQVTEDTEIIEFIQAYQKLHPQQ